MRLRSLLPLASLLALAPTAARALSPATESTMRESLVLLYDLEFERTRARIRELIQAEPDNAFGYFFEAGAIWWQATAEFGLFKDTPAIEGLMEADVRSVVELAGRRFDSDSLRERTDAYFVAGMALGLRGQWHLGRGRFLRAYFDGKKAVKYLKRCAKLDPQYYDAYLGLGVFDYQLATLPAVLKLPGLLMMRGDEKRGLERIRSAVEKGRLVPRQAEAFLLTLYFLEKKDNASALPLVQRLREAFPSSPYFRMVEVALLNRVGNWESSYRLALELHARAESDPEGFSRKQLGVLCGAFGPACFERDRIAAAAAWATRALERASAGPPGPGQEAWETSLRLLRGASYDILNRREDALADYARVLNLPEAHGSHELARRCSVRRCDREEAARLLRERSRLDSPVLPQVGHPAPGRAEPEDAGPEE